ncbi:hypothetical protein M5K25_004532 [Dendrobium thyrsiflorum]|uniref:Carboxypeptidase n=1 Tax=Dendrobium thyrsiflorum TaxID=117978 RepID=A0ABD0VNB8_DENTH
MEVGMTIVGKGGHKDRSRRSNRSLTSSGGSAYVSIDDESGAELFYYFAESERKPEEDPLILWLTGGPGCSGFVGLALHMGPLNFKTDNFDGNSATLVINPYAWTKIASMIFLDWPVGTGFSYSTSDKDYITEDIQTKRNIYKFLRKWLLSHPNFVSNPFYMGGESYGGKMATLLSHEIVEGNYQGQNPLINIKLIQTNCKGEDYLKPQGVVCKSHLQVFEEFLSEINVFGILEPLCSDEPQKEMLGLHRLLDENSADFLNQPSPEGPESQSLKRSRDRSKTALAPLLLLDHCQSSVEPPPDHHLKALQSAGPPPKGPTALQSAGPPTEGPTLHSRLDDLSKARLVALGQTPDLLLKARHLAQGSTICPRPDLLLKARHPAQGSTICLRPDLLLKARHPVQGPTSCSRLDVLPKARLAAQSQTFCSRPDILLKARCPAQGSTFCLRPDVLPKARLAAQGQTSCSRPNLLLKDRHSAQGQTSYSRPDTPDLLANYWANSELARNVLQVEEHTQLSAISQKSSNKRLQSSSVQGGNHLALVQRPMQTFVMFERWISQQVL